MNILILGGSGFVGSNLAQHLKGFFHVKTASRNQNTSDLYFDIENEETYPICNDYDVIINCIVNYNHTLEENIRTALMAKLHFARYLKNLKSHYIEISSVSALQENKYLSEYNFSKYLEEEALLYSNAGNNIDYSILRYAQIIDESGQGRKSQRAFYYFVDCFRKNEILNVFGNPLIPRSYMPVDILVKTVYKCINEKIKGIHNVIMPDTYSANDLISVFNQFIPKQQSAFKYDETKFAFEYFIPPCSESFKPFLSGFSCETVFKNCLLNNEI